MPAPSGDEVPTTASASGLLEIAQRLYGLLPTEFLPARTAAERQARADADRDLAARVKSLRRPTTGAWAVNLLVRREAGQVDEVLDLAERMREAAAVLDGEQLRSLVRQRRQLTAVLTTRARQLAMEEGQRVTVSVAEQVEGTLTAAVLDGSAAEAVRSGLLVATLAATGVEPLDADVVAAAVAVPEALGTRVPAVGTPMAPRAVPENRAVRREAARERVAEARSEVEAARRALARVRRARSETEARRMQRAGELDELRRRAAALEEQIDGLDEELAEHRERESLVAGDVAEAEATLAEREAGLAAL